MIGLEILYFGDRCFVCAGDRGDLWYFCTATFSIIRRSISYYRVIRSSSDMLETLILPHTALYSVIGSTQLPAGRLVCFSRCG